MSDKRKYNFSWMVQFHTDLKSYPPQIQKHSRNFVLLNFRNSLRCETCPQVVLGV